MGERQGQLRRVYRTMAMIGNDARKKQLSEITVSIQGSYLCGHFLILVIAVQLLSSLLDPLSFAVVNYASRSCLP